MDENFDTRRSIYNLPALAGRHGGDRAGDCGASAKFAGSGGAIVGTYDGEAMLEALRASLAALGCRLIKPQVA